MGDSDYILRNLIINGNLNSVEGESSSCSTENDHILYENKRKLPLDGNYLANPCDEQNVKFSDFNKISSFIEF